MMPNSGLAVAESAELSIQRCSDELPDRCRAEWAICDEVIQLREWGTDVILPLPGTPPAAGVGDSENPALRLIARHGARAECERIGWIVRRLDKASDLAQDGERRDLVVLRPGVELGLGRFTLVAESVRFVALRRFFARLLGWSHEQGRAVDLALRRFRLAAAGRLSIVLCGEGDLVPLAADIARRTHGDRPFIVFDPRRGASSGKSKKPPNVRSGLAALAAARGGTICMRSECLPRDFALVRDELQAHRQGQLIVCSNDKKKSRVGACVVIPPLASRRAEMTRIIDEYANEACESLGIPGAFSDFDRDWISRRSASSLHEIAVGTRRIVALRHAGSIHAAAQCLDLSYVALSDWFRRRNGGPSRRYVAFTLDG